ncbi:MAG: CBS domain-containing protein [Planctomycetota bacterium]
MLLKDIMTRAVVSVHMDDSLARIHEIFNESNFHHIVVMDDGKVVGVISDRDLLKNISPFVGRQSMERSQDLNTLKRRAHQIMHRQPICADEDMPVDTATQLFINENVTCLPVISRDRRLRGIITWRDLLPHCFACGMPERDAA